MFKNLIGGEWVEGPRVSRNINPSDTRDVVGEYAQADAAQARQAIAAATQAPARLGPVHPAAALRHPRRRRHRDPGAQGRAGRPARPRGRQDAARGASARWHAPATSSSSSPAKRCASAARWCLRCARASAWRSPASRVGVVGLITPWNFPIAIPAWKIAPGAGLRQHRGAQAGRSRARLRLGARRHPAPRRPAGRRVQPGDGPRLRSRARCCWTTSASTRSASPARWPPASASRRPASRAWPSSSSRWAARIRWWCSTTPTSDVAVNAALNSGFFSTGQRCTASSRLIVTEGIHDRFVAAMAEKMKALKVDDARKEGTDIGPVVDDKQLAQNLEYVAIATAEGARLVAGGEAIERNGEARPATTCARAVRRDDGADAHQPRRGVRPGGERHPREGLRRGAGLGQRHRVRPVRRHRHDLAQVRDALQAPRRRPAW